MNTVMGWPEWIMVSIWAVTLLLSYNDNNFAQRMFAIGITCSLLYWGGFFS